MLRRRKKGGEKTSLPPKTSQRNVSLKQIAKKRSAETKTIPEIKKSKLSDKLSKPEQTLKDKRTGSSSRKPRTSAPRSESCANKKRKTPGNNTSDKALENQHKGQKQVPKTKRAGIRSVGNAKNPRLSQQQNHQVSKNKQPSAKTVRNVKKPKLSAPSSGFQQNNKYKSPRTSTSRASSQRQQNHQKQVSRNKPTETRTVRNFKKPRSAVSNSESSSDNKSRSRGARISGTAPQRKHNPPKQVSRKNTVPELNGNLRQPRLQDPISAVCETDKHIRSADRRSEKPHQHNHEEEMPNNDSAKIGTVGNFVAPILPAATSVISEHRHFTSPGPSTSNISSLASTSAISEYRHFTSPSPSISNISSMASTSAISEYRHFTSPSPSTSNISSLASTSKVSEYRHFMSPGPSTSNISSLPFGYKSSGNETRVLLGARKSDMRLSIPAPGMRMRKSTAVAPAAIIPVSNKYNEIPGPGMRMRKSTAVAPAAIIPVSNKYNENESRTGFNRNLKPLRIVKMAEINGERFFMMKWKDCVTMDLVPVKTAKERCPQVVIQFYESKLLNVFCSSTV